MKRIVFLSFALIAVQLITAQIINIPAGQPTIQDGIISANDGDTVLVHPGIYYENISYMGKGVTLASLFITTGDTSYISITVIDGKDSSSVIRFDHNEDSTSVLCGFTITNGNYHFGGGIHMWDVGNPVLTDLRVIENMAQYGAGVYIGASEPFLESIYLAGNVAHSDGAGIYCKTDAIVFLKNSIIENNHAYGRAGGIRCRSNTYMVVEDCIIDGNSAANYGGGINSTTSEINIINSVISNNSANNGGGIYMYSSISTLVSVDILYNAASSVGGGLALENTSPELSNVNIKYNEADYGGGIDCFSKSNPNLENVLIANNIAYRNGGGIRFNDKSLPYFSEDVRCSIFLNAASLGSDICSSDIDTIIQIKLDTFTVFSPHTYLAFPIENYEFDILNAKVQQITDDLYISPDGDNNNSGLTADQPLKNLWYAFMMVQPDSINPQTFYLANGTYSTSATNEIFPVNLVSHLTLQGESA